MHRSFFATKDTFINSGSNLIDGTTFQDKNVGKDEVLELKKVVLVVIRLALKEVFFGSYLYLDFYKN